MFERFTERARQSVIYAQDEARGLKHNYIGGEHLLLGLLREEYGLGARTLTELGLTLETMRGLIISRIGEGDEAIMEKLPFTPRSKKMLELALREALSLGHNYIGTEHVLLGVVREQEGTAFEILNAMNISADAVREKIFQKLSGPGIRSEQNPIGLDKLIYDARMASAALSLFADHLKQFMEQEKGEAA